MRNRANSCPISFFPLATRVASSLYKQYRMGNPAQQQTYTCSNINKLFKPGTSLKCQRSNLLFMYAARLYTNMVMRRRITIGLRKKKHVSLKLFQTSILNESKFVNRFNSLSSIVHCARKHKI